jgi:hypothetical protein
MPDSPRIIEYLAANEEVRSYPGRMEAHDGPKRAIDFIVIFGISGRHPSEQLRGVADERAAVQRCADGAARSSRLIAASGRRRYAVRDSRARRIFPGDELLVAHAFELVRPACFLSVDEHAELFARQLKRLVRDAPVVGVFASSSPSPLFASYRLGLHSSFDILCRSFTFLGSDPSMAYALSGVRLGNP